MATLDPEAFKNILADHAGADDDQATTVQGRLTQLLVKVAGLEPEDVHPERTIADMGVDSISTVQLAVEIEDEFGVEITGDNLTMDSTVGEIENYISTHTEA